MCKESGEVSAKRTYKDSVFTTLFGDKEKLAELYNAVKGTNYTPDDIELVTLENVLFTGKVNDIAFIAGNRLIIFVEHQSSINPNMPLRFLIYAARSYLSLLENDALYSSRLLRILPPEFIVMYNGEDEFPDESELRLSDAFTDNTVQNLELRVKVYNVNNGRNQGIMSKSVTLNGYSVLVARVRENIANGLDLVDALEKAVRDCVNDNILKEFLEMYGSEVINMMNLEFKMADAQKVWKNDGRIEKAEKVAENLLKEGMTIEFVAKTTELTVEQVEKIARRISVSA